MSSAPRFPPTEIDGIRELFEWLPGPDRVNALALSPLHATYTAWVTVWLLVYQRLLGSASLTQAVAHLQATLFPPGRAESARPQPSANTGAYNHARQRLPAALPDRLAAQRGYFGSSLSDWVYGEV